MVSPYFQSLVENSLTLITEFSEDSSMVVSAAETNALAEAPEVANLKLDLNDKEVIEEELEALMEYPKASKLKILELNQNEFGEAGRSEEHTSELQSH